VAARQPALKPLKDRVADWSERWPEANLARVRRMVQRGEIEHYRIRGRIYLEPDAWERYLEAHRVDARGGDAA
jgi:hypothetical protein